MNKIVNYRNLFYLSYVCTIEVIDLYYVLGVLDLGNHLDDFYQEVFRRGSKRR